jgi:apolipoprotein D and lipocalin family protein
MSRVSTWFCGVVRPSQTREYAMPIIHSLVILMLTCTFSNAQESSEKPVTVVPDVDLNRYMGTWYEIARLPNSFQGKCVSDVTATYSLLEDGDILVVNRCRKADGEFSEAKGKARRASKDGSNSKLEVRFAPSWLSFLPFVWGDYWIMVLAPDYSYVAIGGPDRKYLWVLARAPSMDEATLQGVLEQVRQNGYDLTGLMRTKNTVK